AAAAGQLVGGDGGEALGIGLLEESEVEREPAHGALGDLPHCESFHNPPLQRKSRTNCAGGSVSGRATGSSPSAARPAFTSSTGRPAAATSTLRSSLPRQAACTPTDSAP